YHFHPCQEARSSASAASPPFHPPRPAHLPGSTSLQRVKQSSISAIRDSVISSGSWILTKRGSVGTHSNLSSPPPSSVMEKIAIGRESTTTLGTRSKTGKYTSASKGSPSSPSVLSK